MKSHVSSSCYVVLFINAVFQVQLLFFFSRQALAEGNFKSSFVNTKTAKEGGASIWGVSCGFSKNMSSKERVRPCFWYYHKSHLSWKFDWNFSSRSEDMKNLSYNNRYFHLFSSIFWTFWHSLVTKKLMASVYNRLCQHFFASNIL